MGDSHHMMSFDTLQAILTERSIGLAKQFGKLEKI